MGGVKGAYLVAITNELLRDFNKLTNFVRHGDDERVGGRGASVCVRVRE